jgi:hypothetical protein
MTHFGIWQSKSYVKPFDCASANWSVLKGHYLSLFLLAIAVLVMFVPSQAYAVTHPYDGIGGQVNPANGARVVSIPVKVIFVGIDPATVDLDYSKWNVNVPTTIYGQVLLPTPYLTGVVYKIQYSYTFAPQAYESKLVAYMRSIEVVKSGTNLWFYYYVKDPSTGYVSQQYHTMNYVVYDANKVENWIYNNQQDLGGFPSNGWTVMLMNLTELPSYDFQNYKDFLNSGRYGQPNGTAHYFGVSYTDADLGYTLRYRDFMSGWGGIHRLWFNDFSAGPTWIAAPEELPLQIAIPDNNYDLHSAYGKLWFSEYLADYVSQATINLVTPPLLYDPVFSQMYSFHVHVFDNRSTSEKGSVDIKSTINPDLVTRAFQDLVPYSKIDVSTTFEDITKYPALQAMVHSSYKYADSFTYGVDFGQPQQYRMIDGRPIYKYFQDNMNLFEPNYRRDRSNFVVPIFLFAFSSATSMVFTFKWQISPIGGVALGDIAFVSFSQADFTRGSTIKPPQPNKGLGFTHDVIHEAGHMLGLPHPFDYGPVGNFIETPMSYFTYDYSFGQADKDALRRAHVDSIYFGVQSMINQLALRGADVTPIFNQLKDVDSEYNEMDYEGALQSVLSAESMANNMMSSSPQAATQQSNLGVTNYVIAGVALGLVFGFVAAWILITRRTRFTTPRGARRRSAKRRRTLRS